MSREQPLVRITANVPCGSSLDEVDFSPTKCGYVIVFIAHAHIPPLLLKIGGKRTCTGHCSSPIAAIRSALTQLFLVVTAGVARPSKCALLPNALVALLLHNCSCPPSTPIGGGDSRRSDPNCGE